MCYKAFGDIDATYVKDGKRKEFPIKGIKVGCKLHYNKRTRRCTLHIPNIAKYNKLENDRTIASLDPGVRCFMTAITDNEVLKIGDNVYSRIKSLLIRIDVINRKWKRGKMKTKKKKKWLDRLNSKITHIVDDLHWKTIDYLLLRYNNIVIGDMSAKSISCKKRSNLRKMVKRVAYAMSFYKFRQRLKNKCIKHRIGFEVKDEHYTSKCCSKCGNYKRNLGSSKVYECLKCKIVMDRDVNGARNIFMVPNEKEE